MISTTPGHVHHRLRLVLRCCDYLIILKRSENQIVNQWLHLRGWIAEAGLLGAAFGFLRVLVGRCRLGPH